MASTITVPFSGLTDQPVTRRLRSEQRELTLQMFATSIVSEGYCYGITSSCSSLTSNFKTICNEQARFWTIELADRPSILGLLDNLWDSKIWFNYQCNVSHIECIQLAQTDSLTAVMNWMSTTNRLRMSRLHVSELLTLIPCCEEVEWTTYGHRRYGIKCLVDKK